MAEIHCPNCHTGFEFSGDDSCKLECSCCHRVFTAVDGRLKSKFGIFGYPAMSIAAFIVAGAVLVQSVIQYAKYSRYGGIWYLTVGLSFAALLIFAAEIIKLLQQIRDRK